MKKNINYTLSMLSILLIVGFAFSAPTFVAQSVHEVLESYDAGGSNVGTEVSASAVCFDTQYVVNDPGDSEYRAVFTVNSKNQLLDVKNVNQENFYVEFPEDFDDLRLIAFDYTDDDVLDTTPLNNLQLNLQDCNVDKKDDEKLKYDTHLFMGDIQLDGTDLKFIQPNDSNIQNYQINYQYANGLSEKKYNFVDASRVSFKSSDVLQVTESYQKGDKEYSYKYEINGFDDGYIIREVNSFEVKNINFRNLLDMRFVVISILLVIILIVIVMRSRKLRKVLKQKRKDKREKIDNIKKRGTE